jgi:hypothetical protein
MYAPGSFRPSTYIILLIKWELTSEIGENRFHGFPVLGMMDRKGDDQTSSRTTGRAKPRSG